MRHVSNSSNRLAALAQRGKKVMAGLLTAAMLSAVAVTAVPAASMDASAAASSGSVTGTKWTMEYSFLTLMESSLLNTYTDANGIYEQLKLGIKYKTMSEQDILELYNLGYRIPEESLYQLYVEGWISGVLYKYCTGQEYVASDFIEVFDAEYYMTQNPVVLAAVQDGTLAADEETLFYHYLYCGIPAGLNGSAGFDFAYFEASYPDICESLGYDKMSEVMYYILNKYTEILQGAA